MSASDVDIYINSFDDSLRQRLQQLRELIAKEVPEAVEDMNYGIVGYKLNDNPLVYIGGFKSHIGFYATPNGHAAFAEEFSKYRQGKGSVQFPLGQPLPIDLIKRVVKYRQEQVG